MSARDDQPVLETRRLRLRAFRGDDAPAVQRLAGAREIADTTLAIPHPYPDGVAEAWIAQQSYAPGPGAAIDFALTLRESGELIGSMGLRDLDLEHRQAELGFWVGVPWWRRGYATEAAREVVRFGFETLGLNRIYAHHMVRNPASGRVLGKAGMRREGILRQRIRKWGVFEDVVVHSVLRGDESR